MSVIHKGMGNGTQGSTKEDTRPDQEAARDPQQDEQDGDTYAYRR